MPKVVCNSSPLIHLSKIGRLGLLRDLFQEILVPYEVLAESAENSDDSPDAVEVGKASWIRPLKLKDSAFKRALMLMLDEGESAVITLALEQNADLVVLDDYDARIVARVFEFEIIGTIGILIRMKFEGRIPSLKSELDLLKNSGFWLSEELFKRALREVGE